MNSSRLSTVRQREEFFITLYKKSFPTVAGYIARMGGSLEAAQDVFQDTLVIYYEKVAAGTAENIANENAYLFGIAKKLWLRRYDAESKNQLLDDDIEDVPQEIISNDKIISYLETAGKKCIELLKAYYYDHLPVGNIAILFGYSSTHSATVAKYKCLEKVRETVKQKSLTYADFIE
jgi:DNA-directed RNA polymerase specialized sigma24 family protein